MKKVIYFLVAFLLVLTGCNKTNNKSNSTTTNNNSSTTQENDNSQGDNTTPTTPDEKSELSFKIGNDGTYYVVSGIGEFNGTNLVIPETYKNLPVKEIGDSAFKEYSFIKKVEFPSTLTKIGDYAFYKCRGLETLEFPSGLLSIGDHSFAECTHVNKIKFNERLTTIKDSAFYWCSMLTEVDLPASITNYGLGSFSSCNNLMKVTIRNRVSNSKGSVFEKCYRLVEVYNLSGKQLSDNWFSDGVGVVKIVHTSLNEKSIIEEDANGFIFANVSGTYYLINYLGTNSKITLPSSYKNSNYILNRYAFLHKDIIQEVIILNNITEIDVRTFASCPSLVKATLPNSIAKMVKQCFYDSTSFETIVYQGTMAQFNSITFIEDGSANKYGRWNSLGYDLYIVCTDGTITVK